MLIWIATESLPKFVISVFCHFVWIWDIRIIIFHFSLPATSNSFSGKKYIKEIRLYYKICFISQKYAKSFLPVSIFCSFFFWLEFRTLQNTFLKHSKIIYFCVCNLLNDFIELSSLYIFLCELLKLVLNS